MSTIPEGMTAEKLREIAAWLDLADRAFEKLAALNVYSSDDDVVKRAAEYLIHNEDRSEVQDSLRAWADAIEPKPYEFLYTWGSRKHIIQEGASFTEHGYYALCGQTGRRDFEGRFHWMTETQRQRAVQRKLDEPTCANCLRIQRERQLTEQ